MVNIKRDFYICLDDRILYPSVTINPGHASSWVLVTGFFLHLLEYSLCRSRKTPKVSTSIFLIHITSGVPSRSHIMAVTERQKM